MNTSTQHFETLQVVLSMCIEDDEIIINNTSASHLCNAALIEIAALVLNRFNITQLCQPELFQRFVDDVLQGLPVEGGIIPLDNVLDWIELLSPRATPDFANYSEIMSVPSIENVCVA